MTDEQRDLSDHFTAAYWDERYAGSDRVWSGNPNPRLVEHAGDLGPGTALDVGCGEGADGVWLAAGGWQVTGIDVSQVALDRAVVHARDAGVAERTTWTQVDLVAGHEVPGPFDLVSVQFLHLPDEFFADVYHALAAAVAPGGSLLVGAHHPADAALRNPDLARLLFTPEKLLDLLPSEGWDVRVAASPTREAADREGRKITVTDTVVHAVRR